MEIQETTILLIAILIVIVSIGVQLILMELNSLRSDLRVANKRREQDHSEDMFRLKMLSVSWIFALKENCIAQERYEDANRLNELLEKEYKDCFNTK